MAQVIIYSNESGGVSVCIPTGELPIEQVLAKDCQQNAIIIDESELPTDSEYFNAWELIDGKVVVNVDKKQTLINKTQALINVKESALNKLTALGLTQDEIKTLVK